MNLSLEQTKTSLHSKAALMMAKMSLENTQEVTLVFQDIIDSLVEQVYALKEEVSKSELRERTLEMRQSFEAMEKRFEVFDKHFEAIEKRFESFDKRFETLQYSLDKRFEAMQTYIDERFDDINKRIAFIQWLILFGFTLLYLTWRNHHPNQDFWESLTP